MKILALSDEEGPALWDYYEPDRLSEYDLILPAVLSAKPRFALEV